MKPFYCIFIVLLLLIAAPAFAGETVKAPNVEKGLLEIEQKGRYQSGSRLPKNHFEEFEYTVAYGVTDRWKTKFELVTDEDKKGDLTYRRTRFENIVQTTSAKDGFFVDTALYNDFTIANRSDSSHDITFGVLARKDIASFSHTGNLYVRKDLGDTAQPGINFIYRWQTRYNLMPQFQPGVEILGDTKKKNAFRDQSLGIGPAVSGHFGFDELFGGDKAQKLGYELVYTFGTTPATPDTMLKWKLKYAIQF